MNLASIFNANFLKAFLILAAFLCTPVTAKDQSIFALRSAYLFYFSHFISWPEDAEFDNNNLNLCALTDSKNDRFQLKTIENKTAGTHTLKIVFLDDENFSTEKRIDTCQILYISEEHSNWLKNNTSRIGKHTLLITEGQTSSPGFIHLYTENSKLKFEIDNRKLIDLNFKASSKLLRLSRKRAP